MRILFLSQLLFGYLVLGYLACFAHLRIEFKGSEYLKFHPRTTLYGDRLNWVVICRSRTDFIVHDQPRIDLMNGTVSRRCSASEA